MGTVDDYILNLPGQIFIGNVKGEPPFFCQCYKKGVGKASLLLG